MGKLCPRRNCGQEIVSILLAVDTDRNMGNHYGETVCANGHREWLKKPENENKRDDDNKKHRREWRKKTEKFICAICGSKEVKGLHFEVDHIIPICDGGCDEFENTMMLCVDCHGFKHLMTRHAKRNLPVEQVIEFKDTMNDTNGRSHDDQARGKAIPTLFP